MPQAQAQTQSTTEQQPDQLVTTDYKMTIHQAPQTSEMDLHVSDVDIPSTTEAATQLQNIQFSINKPLVTFNHRYEAIHKVAFRMTPHEQENKTVIVEYAKKLPVNTRDKLLRKIAKKNSYIKTLNNVFKQAIDIN